MKNPRIIICALICLYGLVFNNPFLLDNREKALLGILIYAIPLLINLGKKFNETVKIYSTWFGIFMVIQSIVLFNHLEDRRYITLTPNFHQIINLGPKEREGIVGKHQIITDEMGYRVTKKIDYKLKPENTYRIFAIGGSTTEQIYIDQKQTWTHLLQESLDKRHSDLNFEVINAGVSGLRVIHHIATLQKISKYKPDMAIFLIGINDWNFYFTNEEKRYEKAIFNIPEFLTGLSYQNTLGAILKTGELVKFFKSRSLESDNEKKKSSDTAVLIKYGAATKKLSEGVNYIEYKPESVPEVYKKELNKILYLCDKYKIKCLFMDQPNGYKPNVSEEYRKATWSVPTREYSNQRPNNDSMIYITNLYNSYVQEFAKKNGVAFCSLDSKVPPSFGYMYDDCHYNVKGANRVADVLINCIKEQNLIH